MTSTVAREAWADSARGLAIIAVVLGHVFLQEDPGARWAMWAPAQDAWIALRDLLLPVRMPLFFLLAGYFAAHVIARPWAVVLRTRTASLYYVYLVWLILHTAYFAVVPHPGTASAASVGDFLAQLTYAPSNLWFLVALALFFVVAKAGVRLRGPVLAAAALLSVLAFADRLPDALEITPMPEYLVFFLLGAYAPELLSRIPASAALATAGLAVLVVGVQVMDAATHRDAWTVALLLSTCAGVAAVVSLLKLLEAHGRLPRFTVWAGRRTLPIYVAQLPLAVGVEALVDLLPRRVASQVFGNPFVSSVYPVVVTAAVIGVSLALYAAARRGAPWLYRAPWMLPAPAARSAARSASQRRPRGVLGAAASDRLSAGAKPA